MAGSDEKRQESAAKTLLHSKQDPLMIQAFCATDGYMHVIQSMITHAKRPVRFSQKNEKQQSTCQQTQKGQKNERRGGHLVERHTPVFGC